MSERTWPNWNPLLLKVAGSRIFHISMSERTWPNWNIGFRRAALNDLLNFHVWKDVAQLKRRLSGTFGMLALGFPCLKGRGPIETISKNLTARSTRQNFHVWKDVAQLKPGCILPLKSRGLAISMSERTWPNWNGPRVVWSPIQPPYFHVWKDVAQLKPQIIWSIWSCFTISMSERTWPNWNVSVADVRIAPMRTISYFHVWKDVAQLKPL